MEPSPRRGQNILVLSLFLPPIPFGRHPGTRFTESVLALVMPAPKGGGNKNMFNSEPAALNSPMLCFFFCVYRRHTRPESAH